MLAFRILYQDDCLVAVDKPAGFHTHPPEDKTIRISPKWNGLKILERQFQSRLYPVHRLDRAASGVLVLSRKIEWNRSLQEQFANRSVKKTYACVARGRISDSLALEAPLQQKDGPAQEAKTQVQPAFTFPLPCGESTREFTLAFAYPETGRFHQIRRHLAQASHPLLGDSRHGDKKVNRAVKENTQLDRLFLRCMEMELKHPITAEPLRVRTRWSKEWHRLFDFAGACGWLEAARFSLFPEP